MRSKIYTALVSGIFLFLFSVSKAFSLDFAVIANPGTPQLSGDDIKAVYLGMLKESGGIIIKPYLCKDEEVKKAFFQFLGLNETEFKTIWFSKALAGEGTPPRELPTDKLIEKIKTQKGAIGVIPKDKIPDGVTVLMK